MTGYKKLELRPHDLQIVLPHSCAIALVTENQSVFSLTLIEFH